MADPFQDVDAAGPEFIKRFADAMDVRQSDPTMERIVSAYLDHLAFAPGSQTIEIGAGAGAVTRRIAARAAPSQVTSYEPSSGFVAEARARSAGHDNLSFETADGSTLPLADNSVDAAVIHTVLTHVTEPVALLSEAHRVLKPGGRIAICDADFSKATFSSFANDPLDACAQEFITSFVTDRYIVSKLPGLVQEAGLGIVHSTFDSRVTASGTGMLPWVEATSALMVERGDIGSALAEALVGEYHRREANGSLYGYQVLATLIAEKP